MLVRRSRERGFADHGWLKSFHTFSFAGYYDPKHMNFSDLRVINQDTVMPGGGFGTHPHHNMEIISFVISGELIHKDTLGNEAIIRPGEIQVMSAGTGIEHSEYNRDPNNPVHFLQIWIVPNQLGGTPYYQQKSYLDVHQEGKWTTLVSGENSEGVVQGLVKIRQNAALYLARTQNAGEHSVLQRPGKAYWLQILEGELLIADQKLVAGDGVSWRYAEEQLSHFEWISAGGSALLFELN